MDGSLYSVSEMLKIIAPEFNARIIMEPEYENAGSIIFSNGKKSYFRNTTFNINPFASSEIAKDKHYSSYFLKYLGYTTPKEQTFFSENLNRNLSIKRDINDGFRYARALGFPVILKPNNMSKGRMVAKVYDQNEYFKIASEIFKITDVLLVQKYYSGNDFRVVVLKNKVFAAYRREPLLITGNGKSTINELLLETKERLIKNGRNVKIDHDDIRFIQRLNRLNYSKSTILKKNKKLRVFDNANLSSGGMMYDYTHNIHNDFKELAIDITRNMGLTFCGVDIITGDITEPLKKYIVLEINASPGLNHFASLGNEQFEIVKEVYSNILKLLQEE